MIIRSQDKKFLTDDLKFEIVTNKYYPETDDGEVEVESKIYNSTGLCFGTYSTEEKTVKVLDMIQDAYSRTRSAECFMAGVFELAKGLGNEMIEVVVGEHRKLYVFQMPSDEEVEV